MKERLFRFKQFAVRHRDSAMKVGVDAVLVGSWADVNGVHAALDVGTGCGVIALAVAQRAPQAFVSAVEIDEPSAKEAGENFAASPWSGRLRVVCADFRVMLGANERYDLIVSNPPFFDSGVDSVLSSRMAARHVGCLSPAELLRSGADHLTDSGRIALICTAAQKDVIALAAAGCGLHLRRMTMVRGAADKPTKRVLAEYCRDAPDAPVVVGELVIEAAPGIYTEQYRRLTADFYLDF